MALRLTGQTSGYVELEAPAVAGSNTLVLPNGNGSSGQYLQTNGSGSLSWAGAGKILQVVQTAKTDTFSVAASAGAFSTVMSASITPSATTSKILVIYSTNVANSSAGGQRCGFRVQRGSTSIGIGDAAGSRTQSGIGNLQPVNSSETLPAMQVILDSPTTTSATTYNLQVSGETGAGTIYVNKNASDGDSSTHYRSASHLILMEVAV